MLSLHSSAPPHTLSKNKSLRQFLSENPVLILLSFLAIYLLFPNFAHASSTGMPWESPLSKLVSSITGPVAFAVSVLAIIAAMMGLLFGGDLSGVIKTLLFLAIAIAVVVFATNVLKSLFNVSSSLIT